MTTTPRATASSARQVRFGVAMSLDGYIAGPNGEADWIVSDPDVDFAAMFARFDTLLIGRKTFEAMRKMGGGGEMPGVTAYVLSRTIKDGEVSGATVARDARALVTELKARPGKDIWLFGGGELFRSMLADGLVDGLDVGLIPVLLGGGIPLLPPAAPTAKLKLRKQRVYEKSGTVGLEYDVVRT